MTVREITIDGVDDPRLADYTGLTDVALRRVREPVEGLFIAEGITVIERAVAAGYPLRSVLTTPRFLPGIEALLGVRAQPLDVFVGSLATLRGVTGFGVHRGALAALGRLPLPSVQEILAAADRVVVLEDLIDHANVGAVVRSAAGLGFDGVLISPNCADPLYRRAVKVSMGAVFALPWTILQPWPSGIDMLQDNGFAVLGLTPDEGADDLGTMPTHVRRRCALVVGTEGSGLSAAALAACDQRVRIPMARGVDSLNAAAAAAVACYALTQDA